MKPNHSIPRRGFIVTTVLGLPLVTRWLVRPLARPIQESVICSIYPDGAPWDKPLAYQLAQIDQTAAAPAMEFECVARKGISSVAGLAPRITFNDRPEKLTNLNVREPNDLPVARTSEPIPMSRREFAAQFVRRARVLPNEEPGGAAPHPGDGLQKPSEQRQPGLASVPGTTPTAAKNRTDAGRIGIGLTAIAAIAGAIISRRC